MIASEPQALACANARIVAKVSFGSGRWFCYSPDVRLTRLARAGDRSPTLLLPHGYVRCAIPAPQCWAAVNKQRGEGYGIDSPICKEILG